MTDEDYYKNVHGYIILKKIYGVRNKAILMHRYLMELKIGRELKSNECVHHINGIRDDNRIKNLVILTNSQHTKLHNADPNKKNKKKTDEIRVCLYCNNEFTAKKWMVKRFCNRKCANRYNFKKYNKKENTFFAEKMG